MTTFLNERVLVLVALLAVATALFVSTFSQTFTDIGGAHSPVFFPRIILVIWIGLSLISLAQEFWRKQRGVSAADRVFSIWRLATLIVAVLAYTNLVTSYGYFLTSAVFSVICLRLFELRNPVAIVVYALGVPGALVVFFNHLLGMPLPVSPFTHLF